MNGSRKVFISHIAPLVFILTCLFSVFAYTSETLAGTTTLLAYICGSNIQEDACRDLYEMAEAATGGNVNIVVMAGGSKRWDDDNLNGGRNNLFTISNGAFENIQDIGNESMGSAECLKDFLSYGMTYYPADRTIVILWNHGAGSMGGVCFDEMEYDDGLTLVEIDDALTGLEQEIPGADIDIFGCDACLMADYELAAVLSGHSVHYFIASQESEPGGGWFYTPWLKELEQNPAISDEALCSLITDSYVEEALDDNPDEMLTISVVDLTDFSALIGYMEELAGQLMNALDNGQVGNISRWRSRMYVYGTYYGDNWDMVDILKVLDAFSEYAPSAVNNAKACLQNCIIENRQSDNLQESSGLSILFPHDSGEELYYYLDGFNVSSVIPKWMEFIDKYFSLKMDGNYSFNYSTPSVLSPGAVISGSSWLEAIFGPGGQTEGSGQGENEGPDYTPEGGNSGGSWLDLLGHEGQGPDEGEGGTSDYTPGGGNSGGSWLDSLGHEGQEQDEGEGGQSVSEPGQGEGGQSVSEQGQGEGGQSVSEPDQGEGGQSVSEPGQGESGQVEEQSGSSTGWVSGLIEHEVRDDEYAFTTTLDKEDMQYLDYVEGRLRMDGSDEDMYAYVDFSLMRNNLVDWENGKIYSLFDGWLPIFGDQIVVLYDQSVTEVSRRSLMPVLLNGEFTYLIVVFGEDDMEGRIIGANAGYDENGLPIRDMTKLREGDSIIPLFTMDYKFRDAEEDAEWEQADFEGDEIIWKEGMTVKYEDMRTEYTDDPDSALDMEFSFVLHDIFGDSEVTEPIPFTL